MSKIRVGILGATGTWGQRFLAMLEGPPQFVVTALAASDRSQSRPYGAACSWRLPGDMPSAVQSLVVQPTRPPLDCDVVFSSLPADVAGQIQTPLARARFPLLSHSSSHPVDRAVALLIPPAHPQHLALVHARLRAGHGLLLPDPHWLT